MSEIVIVDIITPQNEILEDSQMPTDYNLQTALDELIDQLELPRLDESANKIVYSLYSKSLGITIDLHNTIQTAGIRNGDTLELRIVRETPASNGSDENPGGNDPKGNGFNQERANYERPNVEQRELLPTVDMTKLNVVLSVIDLNRAETIPLSTMIPVGELIRQIIRNYDLPDRDNLNQLIKYKLQSKALGRFLDERATLFEAGIPALDRLTLHRDEIAG